MQDDYLNERRRQLLDLLEEAGSGLHLLFLRLTLREDAAEELMAELFVNLTASTRLARADNPTTYARRTAISLAFDWRKRHPNAAVSTQEPAQAPGSPETAARRQELEAVLDAVGRLNRDSRDSVVMKYMEQRSYDYIAHQLGKTPQHIQALCHRARQRLRNMLSRKEAYDA